MAATLGRDYIDVKIDTDRHRNGAAVAARLRGDREGGIPWTVITDEHGKELVTSDGPQGNCGCPVTEPECEWFMTMIRKTARTLTADQLATVAAELEDFAKAYRR